MMYSELVKDLRYCSSGVEPCESCKRIGTIACEPILMSEAADAAVFIETCPKCGRDLSKWQVGNLPFTEHYICLCGFEWFERRIPFEPPKTVYYPQVDGVTPTVVAPKEETE